MKPASVLHLIDTGGPGGAETVYLELVRRLDAARWSPVAVVPTRDWLHGALVEQGVEPVVLRENGALDRAYLGGLVRLVRERGVRLIHAHLLGPSLTAGLLGPLCGVPVVSTLHGQADLAPGERRRALKFAILRHGARHVVFVSEPLRSFFAAAGGLRPESTRVIPNGVDAEHFRPGPSSALRAELGIGAGEFVVAAVGNVRPAKAYDVLLRAAALLRERGAPCRFVVMGEAEGPRADELRALRDALGLGGSVVFAGFRRDVAADLRACDALALSSSSEGFSLATVQAMATGLPVVATRCGGPESIVTNGADGLLVANGSAGEMADALQALRGAPRERARLGEAARRTAVERFSIEAQLRAYERVYAECTAPDGSPVRAVARWAGRAAEMAHG